MECTSSTLLTFQALAKKQNTSGFVKGFNGTGDPIMKEIKSYNKDDLIWGRSFIPCQNLNMML